MKYETYEQAQDLQKKIDYYEAVISIIKNSTQYQDNQSAKNRKLAAYDGTYVNNTVTLDEETSKFLCDVLYKKQAEVQEEFDRL